MNQHHAPSALSRPASQNDDVKYYEGNVPLMEARFLELSSSIRALYRSVKELQDFLAENPADDDRAVLVEAIRENFVVLRKQRGELRKVVQGMQQLNAQTEVPDDIRNMVFEDEEEKEERRNSDANDPGIFL